MSAEIRRVVVTGGAGFIGSELVRQLCARCREVVVVDNLANGKRENLAAAPGDRMRLVVADVRDAALVGGLMEGADVVFHLACLGVRHSIHAPAENHEVNADATLRLLIAARQRGVGRFVYVSSSEVYGTARHVPMTEEHPTLPHTVYGASKLAGECYTRAFHDTYGCDTVVVRPFNSYGPRCHHEGDSGEVIPKFLLRCLAGRPLIVFGDGQQTRDFTFVSDTAAGILAAGFAQQATGQTLNLGQGAEISISALAREVAAAADRPDAEIVYAAPRPGDVRRLLADSSQAQRLLDFRPRVTLREGLRRLLEWYRSSGLSADRLLADERVENWTAGQPAHV